MTSILFLIIFIAGMVINMVGVVFAGSFSYAIPFITIIFPNFNFGEIIGNLKVGSLTRSAASTMSTWSLIDAVSFRIVAPILVGAATGAFFISNADKRWLFPVFLISILIGFYANKMEENRVSVFLKKHRVIISLLVGLFAGMYALLGFLVTALIQSNKKMDYAKATVQTRFIEFLTLPVVLLVHYIHQNILWDVAIPWAMGSFIGGWVGGKMLMRVQKWTQKNERNGAIFANVSFVIALFGKLLAFFYLLGLVFIKR